MSEYNDYVTAVNKIFDYLNKLRAGWDSQDNISHIENIEEYTRQYFPDTIEKTFSIGEKGEEDYTLTGYVLNIDYSKVYVRIKCNKPFKKGKGEEKKLNISLELQPFWHWCQ